MRWPAVSPSGPLPCSTLVERAPLRYLRATKTTMMTRAIAYPLSWRLVAALLLVIGRASPLLLLALELSSRLSIPPLPLMRAFAIVVIVPAIAVGLIERAFAVTLRIEGGALVLARPGLRVEIPCGAIAGVDAWTIPLPGGGLWLWFKSGRRFRYGLQTADATGLVEALSAAGGPSDARAALQHPSAIYAHAKPVRRWYQPLLKFVGFGFLATLPLFRVHQVIAYGGTFGEYYLLGLQAYLITFAIYWGTVTIYLVLYAALWRALAEAVAFGAAWVAPSRAARVRRTVETVCRIAYYGGVPVLVTLRFLPW
jgi:apolipoprotein N-acyltransferase